MKKFLAVMLIAVIAVVGVFATADKNTVLNLTYSIGTTWTPEYSMKYVAVDNTALGDTTLAGIAAATFATDVNVVSTTSVPVATGQSSFHAGYVAVLIKDNTAYNLSNSAKTITYTPTVTSSWTTGAGKVNGPTISLSDMQTPTAANVTNGITTSASGTVLTVTYPKDSAHLAAVNQEVGRFAAYWPASDTCQSGDYVATVTIAVATN